MHRPTLGLISNARRRQRLLAGAALVVGVAVIVVLVLSTGSPSSPTGSAAAATASGATTVQRRNLVATDTESGTLSYNNPQTVYDRLSGTITWLPTVGQVIKPGGTLFKVDGQPVVLMDGSTPAYRDLTPSVTPGADVLQLNRNLVRLGFNAGGITVDDVWQAGTTYGVDLLQESLGETETGTLPLGKVVFLPGNQLVSTVDATVGGTGGGGAGTGGSTNASTVVDPPAPEFVSLTSSTPTTTSPSTTSTPTTTSPSTTTTSQTTTPPPSHGAKPKPGKKRPKQHQPSGSTGAASAQSLAALSSLLRAETQQLRAAAAQLRAAHGAPSKSSGSGGNSPSGSSSPSNASDPSGGGGGGSATAVLQTTSTRLVVTVDLGASSQSEAVVGGHVTVEMPDSSTVGGRITAVSPVAQASSSGNGGNGNNGGGSGGGGGGNGNGNGSGGSSSTIPVTITLNGHHTGAGLDQAAVSVNFVQQRANHVLSVPVTALLAASGGSYEVQEATAPHHLIPVTTGLFAAGYVQISGPGIYPGLQVTDSQG
jgi:hypothetical protein